MTELSLSRRKPNTIFDFLNYAHKSHKFFTYNARKFSVIKGDVLDYFLTLQNNCYDITITSPPYGDNHTTVPYGQFSSLPLRWIHEGDLRLEGWELNNYSIIDTKSLGGSHQKKHIDHFGLSLINPYLLAIDIDKRQKVINFFIDYFQFLDQVIRVTKNEIVLTLGNRTVSGIPIMLTDITVSFFDSKGYKPQKKITRKIPYKRIAKKTSCVNNHSVPSMTKEYIIVFLPCS